MFSNSMGADSSMWDQQVSDLRGDTLYRIHGTNEPWSIGESMSSGCIRMMNQDIIDLYRRVPKGAKVVVLPASGHIPGQHAGTN